jgi:hypothetical protein
MFKGGDIVHHWLQGKATFLEYVGEVGSSYSVIVLDRGPSGLNEIATVSTSMLSRGKEVDTGVVNDEVSTPLMSSMSLFETTEPETILTPSPQINRYKITHYTDRRLEDKVLLAAKVVSAESMAKAIEDYEKETEIHYWNEVIIHLY